jgi:hypothetical protein
MRRAKTKAYYSDSELEKFNHKETFSVFDPLTMPHNFSMAIYGRRRSGKTIVLKDILSKTKGWFAKAYLFSETLADQPDLYDFIPEENRFGSFDQEVIWKIFTKQQGYIRRELAKAKSEGRKLDKSELDHVLLIFDDVINDGAIRSSEILNKIHVSGRHTNHASIILSQEVGGKHGINKVQRTNEDIIITFPQKSEYDRELIVAQYLSVVNKNVGDTIFRTLTNDPYNCLVVENYKPTLKYEDFVHWYLAELDIKDFVVGEESESFKEDVLVKVAKYMEFDNKSKQTKLLKEDTEYSAW